MDSVQIIDKLNTMKDELMSRGWGKQRLEHEDGRICLLGARNVAMYGNTLQEAADISDHPNSKYAYGEDELSNVLIDALRQNPYWKEQVENNEYHSLYNSGHIYMYNDHCRTEFNDVLDLIDQAIIIQKEKM